MRRQGNESCKDDNKKPHTWGWNGCLGTSFVASSFLVTSSPRRVVVPWVVGVVVLCVGVIVGVVGRGEVGHAGSSSGVVVVMVVKWVGKE